jgi:hypothetical protein
MKTMYQKLKLTAFVSIVVLLVTSCAPEIKLTSSWTNYQAKVKSSPAIMVIALGKANSSIRQDVENSMVKKLKKYGYNAVPATGLIQREVKHDSAEVVKILRDNNIDMLLTNAVVNIVENERFIPGAIQGESAQLVYSGNYFNYYDNYRTKEAPPTPGTTITDVKVKIESRLFEVATPQLIWQGQSTIYTKEPSKKLINAFSKLAVDDIMKNKLLVK